MKQGWRLPLMRKEKLVYACQIIWSTVSRICLLITSKEFFDCRRLDSQESTPSRVIDLDVDIGAEAVDYKYVFSVESSIPTPSFSQCYCKPRISVESRNRDAKNRGNGTRNFR